jgi:hypothetical protein
MIFLWAAKLLSVSALPQKCDLRDALSRINSLGEKSKSRILGDEECVALRGAVDCAIAIGKLTAIKIKPIHKAMINSALTLILPGDYLIIV